MIYTNVRVIENLPFSDYLLINAHSHSSLKNPGKDVVQTQKMLIGKIVDDILTNDSQEFRNHDLYMVGLDIADKIKSDLGEQMQKYLISQTSYTGTIVHEGFFLNVKGRLDYRLKNLAVIDLKVTEKGKSKKDIEKLVDFMGYDNQIYNYAGLGGMPQKYLFVFSKEANKTFFLKRLLDERSQKMAYHWWAEKILLYGTIK